MVGRSGGGAEPPRDEAHSGPMCQKIPATVRLPHDSRPSLVPKCLQNVGTGSFFPFTPARPPLRLAGRYAEGALKWTWQGPGGWAGTLKWAWQGPGRGLVGGAGGFAMLGAFFDAL